MICEKCMRDVTFRPDDECPNALHWKVWSKRLLNAIEEANGFLYDSRPMDLEHVIECHADDVVPLLRQMSVAYNNAFDELQKIIHATIEWE